MEQGFLLYGIYMHTAGIAVGDGIDLFPKGNVVVAKSLLPLPEDALVGTKQAFDTFWRTDTIQRFLAVFTGPRRGRRHNCIHIADIFGKAAEWSYAGRCNTQRGNAKAEELPLA